MTRVGIEVIFGLTHHVARLTLASFMLIYPSYLKADTLAKLTCDWEYGQESVWEKYGNEPGETQKKMIERATIDSFLVEFTELTCGVTYLTISGGMELIKIHEDDTKIFCEAKSFGIREPRTIDNSRDWTLVFDRYTGAATRYYKYVDKGGAVQRTIDSKDTYKCKLTKKLF